MYLKKLSLINFKNIREENLEFRPGINCFVGDNGAGKTNVIDAVYFLSMCKSSLAMTDGQSVRHGADIALLAAIIIAVMVYAIAIIVFKGIVREDIESLPAGEKIAKVLEKYELLG